MTTKIILFDGFLPMLDEIAKANYGMGLDALDQAGSAIKKSQRQAFRSSKTNFVQFYKNGKLQVYRSRSSRRIGRRLSHQKSSNSGSPENMESFITSSLNAKNMSVIVAGRHKSFTPTFRRDGKVIGRGARVGAVTKGSYAILQKLNSGEASDSEYKKIKRPEGAEFFEKIKFRKQSFIEKGRVSAMPRVHQIMGSKLESMIHRQINRVNVKTEKIA